MFKWCVNYRRTASLAAVFYSSFLSTQPVICQAEQAESPKSKEIAYAPFSSSAVINVPKVNDHFTPIALPGGSRLRGLSLSGNAKLLQTDGSGAATISTKTIKWSERYELTDGCTLLNTGVPVLVHAGPAAAFIAEGTSAVAHSDNEVTRFVNLADHRRGSVRVVFGNHFVDLDPGFEIVLVKAAGRDPKAVALDEGIGWKELHQISEGELQIFVFKIDPGSMMKTCKIYKQLTDSPLPVDHVLLDDIMKTVAALQNMHVKKNGPYTLTEPFLEGPDGKPQKS